MNIEQLRYFKQVCESRSINKAADKLFISQPALTRSIHALEKELGATLLSRDKKGVLPTDIGSMVLENFSQMLSLYDETIVKINNSRIFEKPLIIYSVPSISNACGSLLLNKLHHEFCQLQVNFEEILPKDLSRLYDQPNAVALTFDHEYQNTHLDELPDLVSITLKNEPIYSFAAKDSLYAQGIDEKTQYIAFRKFLTGDDKANIYCNNAAVSLEYILNKHAVQSLPFSMGKLLYPNSNVIAIPGKNPEFVSYKLVAPSSLFESELKSVVEKIIFIMQEILNTYDK